MGLFTFGKRCPINMLSQATRGQDRALFPRQASRRWFLLCRTSRMTLAGRFGVLACALSTHTTGLLGSMALACLFPFRLIQWKGGRFWSRTTTHQSRSFLRAFCPLLDGGQIPCRRNQGTIMEIGGCCACSELTVAVLALVTIENQFWALKQSGLWRLLVLTSTVLLGPSVAQGSANSLELLGAFQQWHQAMSGTSLISVLTPMHPSTQSFAQEPIAHCALWKTECTMWNWAKQRCSFPQHAVRRTLFADIV